MNVTLRKAIDNIQPYHIFMWLTIVWYTLVHTQKSMSPHRWVNCGLVLRSSVKPTHTHQSQTHTHTQFQFFFEVLESVAQLSTLRSDATVSLNPQLGLSTTWSMWLLLLTPGEAVRVDGSSTVVVLVQHRLGNETTLDTHRWNKSVCVWVPVQNEILTIGEKKWKSYFEKIEWPTPWYTEMGNQQIHYKVSLESICSLLNLKHCVVSYDVSTQAF